MQFELKADVLNIDASALDPKTFLDTGEKALNDVEVMHDLEYDKGNAPDGKAQKGLSEAYRKWKAKKFGASRAKADLLLSGSLRRSRTITRRGTDLELRFQGDDARKASGLESRGFRLHFLSKKNIQHIEKLYLKAIDEKLKQLVTVKRKT